MLAVQGDFEAHVRVLRRLGARPTEVRRPHGLSDLAGLVIPGGESTTIMKGLRDHGLAEPVRARARAGMPVLGTCAGLIVLGRDGLGLIDIEVRRNAFGRQTRSFEVDLEVAALGAPALRAVFIRAPWVEEVGPEVEVLAEMDGHPVAVRQGHLLACAFHPELTDDGRLHSLFVDMAGEVASAGRALDGARKKGRA